MMTQSWDAQLAYDKHGTSYLHVRKIALLYIYQTGTRKCLARNKTHLPSQNVEKKKC